MLLKRKGGDPSSKWLFSNSALLFVGNVTVTTLGANGYWLHSRHAGLSLNGDARQFINVFDCWPVGVQAGCCRRKNSSCCRCSCRSVFRIAAFPFPVPLYLFYCHFLPALLLLLLLSILFHLLLLSSIDFYSPLIKTPSPLVVCFVAAHLHVLLPNRARENISRAFYLTFVFSHGVRGFDWRLIVQRV